mgnify:FL=1
MTINIWMIIFGAISGILGGMGMGGGTLLIPLLAFLDIKQQTVQAINLISFLPMAAVSLCFHFKNGLVKTKDIGWLVVPAVIFSAAGAFLTKFAEEKILRYCFGGLLTALGVWQFIKCAIAFKKQAEVNDIVAKQMEYIKNNRLDRR